MKPYLPTIQSSLIVGTFGVGPVVDGTNIKGPPITILASGDPEPLAVEILTSVVAGEGLVCKYP